METVFSWPHLLYIVLVVLSSAIAGADIVVLIALGRGWWISFGTWDTKYGRIFVRERYKGFRILKWYPLVRVCLRDWVHIPRLPSAACTGYSRPTRHSRN
jgi:hypothetical protein